MKNFFLFLLLFSFLSFVFLIFFQSFAFLFFVKDQQLLKLSLKKNFFSAEEKELLVEVAKSEESVRRGLSFREDLSSKDGQKIDALLFIFPKKESRRFWMKDMLFEIDICWLDDSIFLSCQREAKVAETGQNLFIYRSELPANLVLETMPGQLSDEDLKLKLFFQW